MCLFPSQRYSRELAPFCMYYIITISKFDFLENMIKGVVLFFFFFLQLSLQLIWILSKMVLFHLLHSVFTCIHIGARTLKIVFPTSHRNN